MKLLGIAAPGPAASPIFAHRPRESSPAGGQVPKGLSLSEVSVIQAAERLAPRLCHGVHPAVPNLASLVCEDKREKVIPVGACSAVAGNPEAVPKSVEAGASLPMAPPSVPGIEKLIGEL